MALVPAFTPRRWRRFRERGGTPSELAAPRAARLAARLGIGRGEAAALARQLQSVDPAAERKAAAAAGVEIDPWDAPTYPAPLDHLDDPPPLVYRRGALLDCDARAIAVIGSRRASEYGLRVARTLAGDLARSGVTVVAGLARGIDAAAHEAALGAGGRTVAVLGSGLLDPYPPEHRPLLDRIAQRGAVLSELPLRAPPRPHHFPRRNRLVAALALAVVVVEAARRSGADSTVRHALDLGRVVLAVPGPVDSETSAGTLRMLRDGAAPVGSAQDVFAALGWCGVAPSELPDAERAVLDAVSEAGATAAGVAAATGMPEEAAAGYLVTLELRGMVVRRGGTYLPG